MSRWTRHRQVCTAFSTLCGLLLASGAVVLAFALLFKVQSRSSSSHVLRDVVISQISITSIIALGGLLIAASLLGVAALVYDHKQRRARTGLALIALSWILIATTSYTIVIGTLVWFITLQERANFASAWSRLGDGVRRKIENQLNCCGYWPASDDPGLVVSNKSLAICSTSDAVPCVGPVTTYADQLLNRIFTTTFGLTSIQISLFLCAICVIVSLKRQARLRSLDEKGP